MTLVLGCLGESDGTDTPRLATTLGRASTNVDGALLGPDTAGLARLASGTEPARFAVGLIRPKIAWLLLDIGIALAAGVGFGRA